jgi:hypothetical protein
VLVSNTDEQLSLTSHAVRRNLMPTIFGKLSENPTDHRILHDFCRGIFLSGECYAFAIALSQGLCWPLIGLMKVGEIHHAGALAPDGRIHDVRGLLTEADFGRDFLAPPFIIREITAEELYATRPVSECLIKKARSLAEVLFPDLPWIETHAMRVKAFADELEALSRRYGFWISSSVPADPPRLCTGDGDEDGYVIHPLMDGLTYTIRRYLSDVC